MSARFGPQPDSGRYRLAGSAETPDYQVLLVANKYQTGFDQPLLCAMYVDKRLDGVQDVVRQVVFGNPLPQVGR